MNSGVYCIRNVKTGKRYVGSSVDLRRRIADYKRDLPKSACHNRYLQRAWNKYGSASFVFSIIERCSVALLLGREQHWIDEYETADPKWGYNLSPTAGSCVGVKHTSEARHRMSAAAKVRIEANPELIRVLTAAAAKAAMGKRQSPARIARRAAAIRARLKKDPTYREKLKAASRRNADNLEHKARQKEGCLRRSTEEYRAKMSQVKKEQYASGQVTLTGIVRSLKERWKRPEYRAYMAACQKNKKKRVAV